MNAYHHWIQGNESYELRQLDKAIDSFQKAIALVETRQEQDFISSKIHAVRSEYQRHLNDIADLSRSIYHTAARRYGKSICIEKDYYDRGIAYFSIGQFENAIADLSKAHELCPKEDRVWIAMVEEKLGMTYKMKGSLDDSLKFLTKALETYSHIEDQSPHRIDLIKLYSTRAEVLAKLGDIDAAMADSDKQMALYQCNTLKAKAYQQRSKSSLRAGNLPGIIDDLTQAILLTTSEDDKIEFRLDRANAYVQQDNCTDASRELDELRTDLSSKKNYLQLAYVNSMLSTICHKQNRATHQYDKNTIHYCNQFIALSKDQGNYFIVVGELATLRTIAHNNLVTHHWEILVHRGFGYNDHQYNHSDCLSLIEHSTFIINQDGFEELKAHNYYRRGFAQSFIEKNLDEAINDLTQAIALFTSNANKAKCYYQRAEVYRSKKEHAKAYIEYLQVLYLLNHEDTAPLRRHITADTIFNLGTGIIYSYNLYFICKFLSIALTTAYYLDNSSTLAPNSSAKLYSPTNPIDHSFYNLAISITLCRFFGIEEPRAQSLSVQSMRNNPLINDARTDQMDSAEYSEYLLLKLLQNEHTSPKMIHHALDNIYYRNSEILHLLLNHRHSGEKHIKHVLNQMHNPLFLNNFYNAIIQGVIAQNASVPEIDLELVKTVKVATVALIYAMRFAPNAVPFIMRHIQHELTVSEQFTILTQAIGDRHALLFAAEFHPQSMLPIMLLMITGDQSKARTYIAPLGDQQLLQLALETTTPEDYKSVVYQMPTIALISQATNLAQLMNIFHALKTQAAAQKNGDVFIEIARSHLISVPNIAQLIMDYQVCHGDNAWCCVDDFLIELINSDGADSPLLQACAQKASELMTLIKISSHPNSDSKVYRCILTSQILTINDTDNVSEKAMKQDFQTAVMEKYLREANSLWWRLKIEINGIYKTNRETAPHHFFANLTQVYKAMENNHIDERVIEFSWPDVNHYNHYPSGFPTLNLALKFAVAFFPPYVPIILQLLENESPENKSKHWNEMMSGVTNTGNADSTLMIAAKMNPELLPSLLLTLARLNPLNPPLLYTDREKTPNTAYVLYDFYCQLRQHNPNSQMVTCVLSNLETLASQEKFGGKTRSFFTSGSPYKCPEAWVVLVMLLLEEYRLENGAQNTPSTSLAKQQADKLREAIIKTDWNYLIKKECGNPLFLSILLDCLDRLLKEIWVDNKDCCSNGGLSFIIGPISAINDESWQHLIKIQKDEKQQAIVVNLLAYFRPELLIEFDEANRELSTHSVRKNALIHALWSKRFQVTSQDHSFESFSSQYAEINNLSHILYSLYEQFRTQKPYQSAETKGDDQLNTIRALLKRLSEKSHPEAWIALAMMSNDGDQGAENTKYLQLIERTAATNTLIKSHKLFGTALEVTDYQQRICQAILGVPTALTIPGNDTRGVNTFLIAFQKQIKLLTSKEAPQVNPQNELNLLEDEEALNASL